MTTACVNGVSILSFCSGSTDSAGRVTFETVAAVEYKIQVTGTDADQFGAFTLELYGTNVAPVPYTIVGCDPTPPPTSAPATPTNEPTTFPTRAPIVSPTRAPTAPCSGSTYWVHDPVTNAPLLQLDNNTVTCLKDSYNLEVRPCAPSTSPVTIRLVRASDGRVVPSSPPQATAPYFVFGPASSKGDVLSSPKALPKGQYYLSAKGQPGWGKLKFEQDCSCPSKGKEGVPGCRKRV